MNIERKVYVKRGIANEWIEIDFQDIVINEDFILCESDGVPVGHYFAISQPYFNKDGIGTIKSEDYK